MNTTRHISMLSIRATRRSLIFNGNVMKGTLNSKTATRLVREWIDLRLDHLMEDWELARVGKEVKKIAPLE